MSGGAVVGSAACPTEVAARLLQLRNEAVQRASGGRFVCARSKEWAGMPVEVRMALLLVAGVDGDLSTLARRGWLEFAPPEREAARSAMREFRRALSGAAALCSRWGDDG